MAKILITGGTGFVGSHLVEHLVAAGEQDIHVTAYRDAAGYVAQLIPAENIHQLNLTDYQATDQLLAQLAPEEIYHLASLANVGQSFDKIQFVLQTNLQLQLNLLEIVKNRVPQARLLSVGSALAYKSAEMPVNEEAVLGPDNPYALSKVIQDLLSYTMSRMADLDIVRALPFNHIGERQAAGFVVADFARAIAAIEKGQQDKLAVGNLETIRDFSDVKDVVAAYSLLMKKGQRGEAYNIGSGRGYQIKEILERLLTLAQRPIEVVSSSEKFRPVDQKYLVCNNEKIKNLGWQPQHQLDETLARILNWWREQIE